MTVEDLRTYGIERMDREGIDQLLAAKNVGVLGLPTDGSPSMRPMSFSFDGEDTIHFVYVLGDDSRKAAATDRADAAQFLVYSVETPFNWRSVIVTGAIERVPEEDESEVAAALETAWRPEVFERATAGEDTALYRLRIDDREGLKHLGLPPGLDTDESGTDTA